MRLICRLFHRRHRQPPEVIVTYNGGTVAVWCERCQRTWRPLVFDAAKF